ncbi:unnamed protein product [Cylicocyclus nassatus]|uniref:Fibronectin type-III domain-containing protein n=1 Tax=Cylicocyclus nassatus TaxID=53992 RepID=A0AA36DNM8_CYLNA|nr:unnamed protein product [Cylicocyclus nassatus]
MKSPKSITEYPRKKPSGVYCNCPVERTHRSCNSVDAKLARAMTVPIPSSFSSEYLDAHTIRVQIPPYPSAFAYIFEYATVSTQSEEWYFAGASTNPMTTFTILDPCRDYKFRGYSDSDIYGYEAPALYPLQCRTPEDELPQPKIEIVRAGGRLAVSLPSTVLEARCRLWVEVRMLPRCVRLEPFSVQKNIEIDCEKNPELDVCTKEANPVCMEILDVHGKRGHVTITWQPADRSPLYYHVRYGPAQMKGNPPFVTWQLATKRDIKVDGTVTSLTLDVAEDQDFGIQVCAILTTHRKRPKFGLIRVTPFQCTSCKNQPTLAVGRCGECGRIEGTTVSDGSWKDIVRDTGKAARKEKPQIMPQTVFRMETDLLVNGHPRASGANTSIAHISDHAESGPISLERAEQINEDATSTASSSSTTTASTTSYEITITTTETSAPTTTEETTTSTTEPATTTEPMTSTTVEATETTQTTVTHHDTTDATTSATVEIVEVETKLRYRENPRANTAIHPMTVKIDTEPGREPSNPKVNKVKDSDDDQAAARQHLSDDLEESVKHLEKALEEVEHQKEGKHVSDTSEQTIPTFANTTSAERAVKIAANELVTKLESTSAELRHHEKSKKCLLSTGIVCNFGCETNKTCRCPVISHVLSPDGGCLSRELFGHTLCLPKSDVNATWDPISMNVLVRSQEASDHISSVNNADRLFVEFGKVKEEEQPIENAAPMLRFDGQNRSRLVVSIEKLLRSQSFSREPFVFHVNDSVNADTTYGMRFCTFNSTHIKDPYVHNWDLDISANKTGSIVQVRIECAYAEFS